MPGGTFFWPSEGPKLKRYTGSDPNDATPERFYHILKPYQESKNAYLPSCFRVLNSFPRSHHHGATPPTPVETCGSSGEIIKHRIFGVVETSSIGS